MRIFLVQICVNIYMTYVYIYVTCVYIYVSRVHIFIPCVYEYMTRVCIHKTSQRTFMGEGIYSQSHLG